MSDWVSVKDRVPEEGQDVLVYDVGSILMAKYHVRINPPHHPKVKPMFWDSQDPCWAVSHWMLLPGPPDDLE